MERDSELAQYELERNHHFSKLELTFSCHIKNLAAW